MFDRLPRDRGWFLLWQNDRAVIVGRHQNTLAEIDEDYVRSRGIRVVRRLSGGGAVYHDLGNLNFTFIQDAGPSPRLDLGLFCRPVARALRTMGVEAEVNGRNDITIGGLKFSGNAQYVREGRVMHHGTILFDSDLEAVGRALRPDPEKIAAKGVRSVPSRMTTLRRHLPPDVDLPAFRAAFLEALFRGRPMAPYALTAEDLAAVERLRAERYAAWDWNYGGSPPCDLVRRRRVEGCGTVEVRLRLERGRIAAAAFRGDFFSGREPEALAERLVGLRPVEEDLSRALEGVDVGRFITGLDGAELLSILRG